MGLTACAVALLPTAAQARDPRHALPDIRDAYGVSLADFNGDGKIDLYLVGFRSLNRLLLNQGDGTYKDASIQSGAGGNLMPQGVKNLELGASAADFDNDGAIDMLIGGWGEGLELLRNRGDGTFTSVTDAMRIKRDTDANMGLWGDLNSDGWLDLLITNETGPMRLYRNEQGLRFTRMSLTDAGLPSDTGSQAAVWADLDLDGDLDLAVAGWRNPISIFQMDKPFHFSEIPVSHQLPPGSRCNAILLGDVDNDGDADLLATVRHALPVLLINQTNPSLFSTYPNDWFVSPKSLAFEKADSAFTTQDTLDAYGGLLEDFDADGDIDLIITGRQPIAAYANRQGRFYSVPQSELGFTDPGAAYSTGMQIGDLTDSPGLEAVIAARDTGTNLQEGLASGTRHLLVELHGIRSNPNGLGSHVTLWRQVKGSIDSVQPAHSKSGWEQIAARDLPGGSGYLSSYVGPVILPIYDTVSPLRVCVRFSTGKIVSRKVDPHQTHIEIWEYGFFGSAYIQTLRAMHRLIHDPIRLRNYLAILIAFILFVAILRYAIRFSAAGIARRQYTRALEDKNQELEHLLASLHKAQQQLIHHEKLASLGQLVAGIAHELNNPIGFIYANLHQIGRYLESIPESQLDEQSRKNLARVREALNESEEGALRVRDIVQNLRGLARSGSQKPDAPLSVAPCSAEALLEKSLVIARTQFSPEIMIEKHYAPIPDIAVDAGQIQQVLINILVNAAQALGNQGTVTLTIRQVTEQAEIVIADSGPGIATDHLSKLFDPFFTTKSVGQGLGLGLHISYSIAKAHGGDLSVESELGKGAIFRLKLPIVDLRFS